VYATDGIYPISYSFAFIVGQYCIDADECDICNCGYHSSSVFVCHDLYIAEKSIKTDLKKCPNRAGFLHKKFD